MTTPTRGPRDEYRSSYPDPTTGLRWALALVSVIAVAAVIVAVTLWLKPRHVEQASQDEKKASTGVPRADLEQITGQELRLKFPGPPVRISCPGDLPAKVGATEECVLRRFGNDFRLTITATSVVSPTDVNWSFTLGEKIPGS